MKECTSKPHIALRNLFLHNLKYILLIAVPCIALILVFLSVRLEEIRARKPNGWKEWQNGPPCCLMRKLKE